MATEKHDKPAEPAADPMTVIAAAMLKLAENQQSGLTPELVEAIATASASSAAKAGADSMRHALHPQNASHPGKSAFSYPEGDRERPKPILRPDPKTGQPGDAFFCFQRLDPEQLTPQSIDLLNRFTQNLTARNGRWRADIAQNGVGLHITVPCKTIDDRMDLPAFELILLELLDGQSAVNTLELHDRVAHLERELATRAARA